MRMIQDCRRYLDSMNNCMANRVTELCDRLENKKQGRKAQERDRQELHFLTQVAQKPADLLSESWNSLMQELIDIGDSDK